MASILQLDLAADVIVEGPPCALLSGTRVRESQEGHVWDSCRVRRDFRPISELDCEEIKALQSVLGLVPDNNKQL